MGFQGGPSRPGITYSCWAENERAALTRLIDRFARLHHLALQLHPRRCKERQMWYLASCQDTSFFLKVRHTSPAALSRVLLSVTTLPSALKMPFSNMVKEEWVIQRENRDFFSRCSPKWTPACPTPLYCQELSSILADNSSWRYSFTSHQTGRIHLTGLTSHGCSHPATWRVSCCTHNMTQGLDAIALTSIIRTTHRKQQHPAFSFTSGVIFIVSSITLYSSLRRQSLPLSISWSFGARGQI